MVASIAFSISSSRINRTPARALQLLLVLSALMLLQLLALPLPAAYAGVDEGFQMWTPMYLDAPIGTRKIRGYFEVNPRMQDGMGGIAQLIVRPAIGYRFNERVSAFSGYAWVSNWPNPDTYFQEQRVWQQVGYGFRPIPKLILLNRFRLEERFIQHTNEQCAVRFRYMLRGETPIPKTKNYAVVYDELFVNFNTLPGVLTKGIDQNRLYAGIGRRFNRNMRAEVAYQNQYVNRDAADDKASHILMTSVYFDF